MYYLKIYEKNLNYRWRRFCRQKIYKIFFRKKNTVLVVDNISKYTGGIHPKKWPMFKPFDYKNFRFIKEDCRNWFLKNKDNDFDYVLHLAAVVGGRNVIEGNPLLVADDLSIDSHYWQWAAIAKPKKTLCFSSSACYPINLKKKEITDCLKKMM